MDMARKVFGFVTIIALAGALFFYNKFYNTATSAPLPFAATDSIASVPEVVKEPRVLYGMVLQDDHVVIEDKIKRNQFLGDILQEYNVPANLIHQVSQLSRKIFDPRKITPNSNLIFEIELLEVLTRDD